MPAEFHLVSQGGGTAEPKLSFPLGAPSDPIPPPLGPPIIASMAGGDCLKKASRSRMQRRERRAAERAATEKAATAERAAAAEKAAAAKKAATEKAASVRAATESAATPRAATEKKVAELTAAEKIAVETVNNHPCAEKALAESETVNAKETATPGAATNTFYESDNLPSTCCSGQLLSKARCWKCDREMSDSHQCDLSTVTCETRGKAVSSVTPPGSPEPAKTRGWGPPTRRRIY